MDLPPEVATIDQPAISPSGEFVLVVLTQESDGNQAQSFQILDRNDNVVYSSQDSFFIRDTTFFLWGPDDRVWVYSGDLGTFFWENQGDPGSWEKHVYAESDIPAPQFLKNSRPRWHQR